MKRTLTLISLFVLAGCGGHGGGPSASPSAKGGKAVLNVAWPDRSAARLIPNAANSLVVILTKADGTAVQTQKIARPAAGTTTTSTTFSGLPYGDLHVAIAAYPSADGSGVAQATGADTLKVVENQPAAVDVALGSTVKTLSISPSPAYVPFGGTITLTATAKDANGAIVLLAAGGGSEGVTWYTSIVSDTLKATSGSPTTTVTGIGVGSDLLYASLKVSDDGTTVTAPYALVTTLPTTLAVGLQPEYVYGTNLSTFSTHSNPNSEIFGAPVSSLVGLSAGVSVSPRVAEVLVLDASTTGPIHLVNLDWSQAYALYVPIGNSTGSGPAVVDHVDVDTAASVTATLGPLTSTATTTIKPDPLASVAGPASVASGASATGTVTLGLNSLASETVALSCDDPGVALPASVAVAPSVVTSGSHGNTYTTYTFRNSVTFAFTVPTVTTARTATITATRAGISKSFTFTITP